VAARQASKALTALNATATGEPTAISAAVYAAEDDWSCLYIEPRPLTDSEANELVRKLLGFCDPEKFGEDRCPVWDVIIDLGEGVAACVTPEGSIYVASFPVETATIVHECAHVLTHHFSDGHDDNHCAHFRAWHVFLVRWVYGGEAAELLASLYDEHISLTAEELRWQ
jgi:hypothetical protein